MDLEILGTLWWVWFFKIFFLVPPIIGFIALEINLFKGVKDDWGYNWDDGAIGMFFMWLFSIFIASFLVAFFAPMA